MNSAGVRRSAHDCSVRPRDSRGPGGDISTTAFTRGSAYDVPPGNVFTPAISIAVNAPYECPLTPIFVRSIFPCSSG
jgi:hypothetical protein